MSGQKKARADALNLQAARAFSFEILGKHLSALEVLPGLRRHFVFFATAKTNTMRQRQTDSTDSHEHDACPKPGGASHFQTAGTSSGRKKRQASLMLAVFCVVAIPVLLLVYYKDRDFLVVTDEGLKLDPKTEREMEESIRRLYKCEQYALVASEDGRYTCFTCAESEYPGKKIYLRRYQIVKYGTTCIGKKRRGYTEDYLLRNRLEYLPQYKGNETDCKAMERRKIYSYPLLPENFRRQFPLRVPPGNKNHN